MVQALPSCAVLTFTDAVTEVLAITVTGPDGSVVNGDPTSTGAEVRQSLWAGPDGAYVMTYHVMSSDGHEVRGEVHFVVGSTLGRQQRRDARLRSCSHDARRRLGAWT